MKTPRSPPEQEPTTPIIKVNVVALTKTLETTIVVLRAMRAGLMTTLEAVATTEVINVVVIINVVVVAEAPVTRVFVKTEIVKTGIDKTGIVMMVIDRIAIVKKRDLPVEVVNSSRQIIGVVVAKGTVVEAVANAVVNVEVKAAVAEVTGTITSVKSLTLTVTTLRGTL